MTRKEAFDILMSANVWNDEERTAWKVLVPELAESEDERIIKTLQEYVKNRNWNLGGPTQDEVLAWLKKKKEQKPEWSEEDEDMLNCCISSIEEAKENRYAYKETDGDTSYDREIDWLKSLRPSWKPSEEQMAALEAATVRYQSTGLESLFEDLKKL